ncbi:MAG: uL15 family ribosomal protein [bacterium]|nr:uL15 family ribosomal protein [bacterium]
MQIHNLKRNHPNRKKIAVGRGGKRGKTSGRGTKGQKARAGRKIRPEIRDFIKRLPKLRGRGKNSLKSITLKPVPVNLDRLDRAFADGDTVNPQSLVERGIINKTKGNWPRVKILADGTLGKKITIEQCLVSKTAREKIVQAGGVVV